MDIILYNARILTMNDDEAVFHGNIYISGNQISRIEQTDSQDVPAHDNGTRIIDCHGNLLMPGFKNAHTHSAMSVLRSLADDLPLNEWLTTTIFPREAKLKEEDMYPLTQLSVLEYLTSGITACLDMYLSPSETARAMSDMGFRCVATGGINEYGHDIEWIDRYYEECNARKDSTQSYIFGFHAEYTSSKESRSNVARLTHKHKAPFFTHACETEYEVEDCKKRTGLTPMQVLDDAGLFDYGGGIYHGVHMSEVDYDIIKKRGLFVVTNPGSNTKLASGIAPITEYLRRGIPVAIGTDGPASNNCLDFFREMFLVTGLAKLREKDAAAIDAREVLRMATVNGAHAMGLNDCDVLAEGKKADIIMIDLSMPNMQPLNNIEKNIVYSGSKINVAMTMIDGKVLYENGRFYVGAASEDIYDKVAEIGKRIQG